MKRLACVLLFVFAARARRDAPPHARRPGREDRRRRHADPARRGPVTSTRSAWPASTPPRRPKPSAPKPATRWRQPSSPNRPRRRHRHRPLRPRSRPRISLGRFINADPVRAGFAWRYAMGQARRIRTLEADARRHRRGLWADSHPVPPWEFRGETRRSKRRAMLIPRGAVRVLAALGRSRYPRRERSRTTTFEATKNPSIIRRSRYNRRMSRACR